MFSRKKDSGAEGGRMYYTDYSDADLQRMLNPRNIDREKDTAKYEEYEKMLQGEHLQENVRERGAAWSEKVDIALKALNDGLVAQEESSDPWAAAQPEIKATVMQFECVSRAAVTEQLEITKGRRELAIGWIEPGQIVQAKLIGTTKQTRRQRIMVDGRDTVQGWVSVVSVDGQHQLLKPLQAYTPPGQPRPEALALGTVVTCTFANKGWDPVGTPGRIIQVLESGKRVVRFPSGDRTVAPADLQLRGKLEDVRDLYTPLLLHKGSGSINNKQNGKETWRGSAYRLGVEFAYDETFLPPQTTEANQRRNGQVEVRIRKTPKPATEWQKQVRQDEASQRSYGSMVRALFTPTDSKVLDDGSYNRDVNPRTQKVLDKAADLLKNEAFKVRGPREEQELLEKFPWPPKEEQPPALAFGHQPEKNEGYYAKHERGKNNPVRIPPMDRRLADEVKRLAEERPLTSTGPSSYIDSDYLAHLTSEKMRRKYGDEPVLANLTAERTAELSKSYSGTSTQPSERRKPVAIDIDALDPGKLNRRRPRTSDGALCLSWAQRCLSHDDAPYKTQMIDYVSTDFEGSEWLTLKDKPRQVDEDSVVSKRPQLSSFSDAGAVPAPSSLRHKDAKRYSALYAKKLSDQGRKKKNVGLLAFEAKVVSKRDGTSQKDFKVLATQASKMSTGGVYRRGTTSVARRLIEEEAQKIAAEERAEQEKIEQEQRAAKLAAEAEEARLAAEAKAAEEKKAAARALREKLDMVLDIGGIDKVRSQTLHSEDPEVREAGQTLLDALPQNVEELLYEFVKEKALANMASLQGESAMVEWSEAEALDWATGVGLLLHTAVENTDWQIMPTGQCTMSELLRATFQDNRLDGRDVAKITPTLMGANLRKAGLTDCAGCSVLDAAELVIQHRDAVLHPPRPAEEESVRQHAAAIKIQAHHRGRSDRRQTAAMRQTRLEPEPESEPEPKRYIAPSKIQRLVGFGNAEAMARANGVESLSRRIQDHDEAKDRNAKDIEATQLRQQRMQALTNTQNGTIINARFRRHFDSRKAFEEEVESTANKLKDLQRRQGELDKECNELHALVEDTYTTIKMVAVRKDFDMKGPVIHTLRAGDTVKGLEMRIDSSTKQPRLLIEVRHYVRGWVNLMTEGRMTVMVERTSALEAKVRAEKKRKEALVVHGNDSRTRDQTDPVLETYKRILRGVTYDSGTRADGSSMQLPWRDRFNKYDTDRSGLLNPTEFHRCIRRYCSEDSLCDHCIANLIEIIDADGSGEISIEEFEDFLHDSPGYKDEVNAAAMIQANFRGRKVRQHNGYKASVKTLEIRADIQAEQLKRLMRGIGFSRGGMDWRTLFCAFDTDGSGQLDQNEFRIACRSPGHGNFSMDVISDRELLILFKRFDSDGSGTISYDEFENFLHSGPSADAEVNAVIRIQARQRGKMVRRRRALHGVKMLKFDVERNNWKLEKLTDDTEFDKDGVQSGMWGVLCAALSKHGHGAVIFLSTIARAEWLAMRLVEKKEMVVTVITGDQEPDQRKRALDEWAEGRGEHGAPDRDRYGRRRLIIVAEMPTPQALMQLRLNELNLQLAIHYDVPKFWQMYIPRHVAPFPRYKTLLLQRGISVVFYSNGEADANRLLQFERKSGYPLPALPDDCARQMFALVDEMRVEASTKKRALGLASAARNKHAGDSWLPDIVASYECLMEKGARAMRAASYDLACEIYTDAAHALHWKEEPESDTEYADIDSAEKGSASGGADQDSASDANVVSPAALRAKLSAKPAAQNADT